MRRFTIISTMLAATAVALSGTASTANQAVAATPPLIASSPANQQARTAMGLPAEPASRDTERRGMSFSKTEAASFDRYFRILDQNRAIQRELENHPNILNFYVEPSISTPMFTFTVDSGARGAVDVLLKTKLVDVDYRVIEAPVDRLTRDTFWQTLRFEFIHIREKSNYRTPIVDAMRTAGLDP